MWYSKGNSRIRLSFGSLLHFEHVTDCKHMRRAPHMQLRSAIEKRRAPLPILWGVYWLFRIPLDFRTTGRFIERICRRLCHLWVCNTYAIDYSIVVPSYMQHRHFRTDESTRPDSFRAIPVLLTLSWVVHVRPQNNLRVRDQWNWALSMIHSMILDARLSLATLQQLIDLRRTKWFQCQRS